MLNMGNGERSVAQVHAHVRRLLDCFDEMGDAQQSMTGPNPAGSLEIVGMYETAADDAEAFIIDLARDLGFKRPVLVVDKEPESAKESEKIPDKVVAT